ncbi:F0F1 ATP synthase subunit delta [Candidatus Peregrinibacteria bacterium]|nr:F0F1 ATP synthase subunit delta [Candidatus Peregrinibacteria bacterium]
MQQSPKTIASAFMDYIKPEGKETVNAVMNDLVRYSIALRILGISSHFKNPKLSFPAKEDWLKSAGETIAAGKKAQQLVLALLSINQLGILSKVVSAMKELRLCHFGVGEGEAVTAAPLTPEQKKSVTDIVKKMSGLREAIVVGKVNPAVLGGISIASGDKLLDGTLQRQLKNMLKLVS